MANLNIKVFEDILSDTAAAIQSSTNALIDFSIGSILRAIAESNATLVLWIQGLILQLLTTIRAATCTGSDLDSWCADYSFTRLPALTASGLATFARFTPTNSAFIPVGTIIQTADATAKQFSVIADTTNAYYSAALGGFTIPAGTGSIQCTVVALVAGAAGNILLGQLSVLTGSIPGVDTVTNPNAFINGVDAEMDNAMRTRFVTYIGNLAKATKNAISNAISSVQSGISFTLTENYNYAGTFTPGYFYVVVDDGSGSPPSGFLNSVNNAIDAVRAFTITFGVFAPVLITANVAMTVTSSNHAADATAVQAAINSYIAGLGIGASLPYTKLAQIAYDTASTISNVTLVQLNSATADISATAKQRIMPGAITIS
jgi:uncharacterized phage protein gp47/JayE